MGNEKLVKNINEAIDSKKDRLIDLCVRLINLESVTGNEFSVQKEVKKMLEEVGFEVDEWIPEDEDIKKNPLFADTGESFENRPVIVGLLRGENTGKGKSLLINGHVDVVNASPLEKWLTDPFHAEISNGKIFGRGASDMKSGLAAAIFSVEILKDISAAIDGDITIVSVPGEENGGNGTAASLLRGYTNADGAIYPEPTSNQIQPAHRGAAFWKIVLEGKASHGGTKYKGVSAVEKGIKVVEKLADLEKERNEEICGKHPMYKKYPISAPVTVGIFNGGQFTSGVPESCTLEGCIEYVPGEHSEAVIHAFEKKVMSVCESDAWLHEHPPVIEWFGLLYEPAETKADNPLVQGMVKSYCEITGTEPSVNGFEAGTDMRFLTNKYGIPGLMFGAGDIAMAHTPNEYVEIEELVKGAKIMTFFMAEWCGLL